MSRLQKNLILCLIAAAIACAAVVIYLPTLDSGFIWDDDLLLIKPFNIGTNPYSFFFAGGIYFRPMLHISMATDYSLWHLNPKGYHATNIILHALNSLLVALVFSLLLKEKKFFPDISPSASNVDGKGRLMSSLAGVSFALHPIHTESVAWISGRTDIITTLFFLLAFLSFLLYVKEGQGAALLLSGIFFLGSLFAKENAAAFIGVVIAYGLLAKIPRRKFAISVITASVTLCIYLLFRGNEGMNALVSAGDAKKSFFASGLSPENIFTILINGTGYYFEKLVLPFNLNLLPQIPESSFYLLITLLPFVIMVILYFVGHRLEVFLIAWGVMTLLPSLAILFSQMAAPIGERYLYLPSAGFCLLLVTVLTKIRNPKIVVASVLVILSAYAFSTFDRVGDWKDEVTIWEDTAQKNSRPDPNTVTAYLNYGAALARIGEFEKAREMLMIALGQKKISSNQAGSLLNLLGMIEIKEKNYQKAEENFLNSLKLYPDNAETYNNLGFLYSVLKDEPGIDKRQKRELIEKAIEKYHRALSLFPHFIQAKYNLGISYLQLNDLDNAEKFLNAVIKSDPQGGYATKAANLLTVIEFKRKRLH